MIKNLINNLKIISNKYNNNSILNNFSYKFYCTKIKKENKYEVDLSKFKKKKLEPEYQAYKIEKEKYGLISYETHIDDFYGGDGDRGYDNNLETAKKKFLDESNALELSEQDHFEKIKIPKNSISMFYRYAKSSGPGGQNVNKVNTKCELRVNLTTANWIPSWVKENIHKNFSRLINKENELIIVSMRHRTQEDNKRDATEKFQDVLDRCSIRPKIRIKTEKPQYANEQRLTEKKFRKDIKTDRKKKQIHEYFNDR